VAATGSDHATFSALHRDSTSSRTWPAVTAVDAKVVNDLNPDTEIRRSTSAEADDDRAGSHAVRHDDAEVGIGIVSVACHLPNWGPAPGLA